MLGGEILAVGLAAAFQRIKKEISSWSTVKSFD
jgi:hypothetical protein